MVNQLPIYRYMSFHMTLIVNVINMGTTYTYNVNSYKFRVYKKDIKKVVIYMYIIK